MKAAALASLALCLSFLPGSAAAQSSPADAVERMGVRLQSGTPMKIRSDELDAVREEDGAERIIFRQNVRVEQGDLRIYCDWLEALYLNGAGGQADRVTARGKVRLLQAGSEASCSEAVFDNVRQTASCTTKGGKSRLRRGKDVIKADRIDFDLKTGRFRASGAVEVEMGSDGETE